MKEKILLAPFLLFVLFSYAQTEPVAATLPPLKESTINIPVKVVMKPLLDKATQLMPKEVTSEGWPNFMKSGCDYQYKYRFIPGALSFNCVNNNIQVKLNGTYQVAGEKCICAFGKQSTPWVGGSCGFGKEPMRKTEIYIGSALNLLPNYSARTTTAVQKVVAPEKCMVTVFNMDITQQISDSIKASTNAFCYAIDSAISSYDFSKATQQLAERINKKIALADYGYLKINPSAVKMGYMNYIKDTLVSAMSISCFPELGSDSTNNYAATFLPPLQTGPVNGGITLYTNARYDYPFISSFLNKMVKDSSFELEGTTIIIKNVTINGAGNGKVEMNLDFEGDKSGTLYLIGTPVLDTAKQIIYLPDLDYSLKSRDLVLTLGKTLFNKKIVRKLREQATVNIKEMVEANRADIDAQLNKAITPNVESKGALVDFNILALVTGKDQIQAQTRLRVNAAVIIKSL